MSAARETMALLLAALLAVGAVRASVPTADQRFHVDRWGTAEGLPVNGVNQVHVSPSGYLWLATFDGLARFDGHRFATFVSSQDQGLPNNRLLQLVETGDGLLWLLTETGQLVSFDGRAFDSYDRADGLPDARLFAMQSGPDGELWAHTYGGTARRVGRDRFERYSDDPRLGLIGFLAHAPDGALWAASTTGVHRLDGGARESYGLAEGVPEPTYYFAWDRHGRLWLPGDDFVARLDADGRVQRAIGHGARRVESIDDFVVALADTVEFTVHGDGAVQRRERAPEFAIAMRERLLGRAPDGALWRNRIDALERDGEVVFTSPCKINHFAFDSVGAVWIASSCEGLVRLRPRRIEALTHVGGAPLGSSYGLAQAPDGALWIATNTHGVAVLPAVGEPRWIRPSSEAGANTVWIGADGETWIDGCRVQADGRCEAPSDLPSEAGGGDDIRALHRSRDGSFWVGGRALLQRTPDGVWRSLPSAAGLGEGEAGHVRTIAESRSGTLWFGTRGRGLLRRDARGALRRFARTDGLASDAIRALREDRDGQLWIATEDRGLCRMREPESRAPRIDCLGRARGLWSNSLHQLIFDDDDRLWINSNHGVFVLPRAALEFALAHPAARVHPQVFTERDGLPDREGNGGANDAGIRLADGRIAFPTVKGVALFDPAALRGAEAPARAVFETLELPDGRQLPVAERIELPRGERSFVLRYAGLTPAMTTPVYFRYRLLPETGWMELGDARQLSLTRLPPGDHELVLEAFDSSGEAGPQARLRLHVPPWWYETTPFHFALAALLAGLIVAWVLHQRRDASLRQRELERTVAQRTVDLRGALDTVSAQRNEIEALAVSKSRFFANVSHELRTPLTLIAGPLRDAGDDGVLDARSRRLMRGNAERLERLVEQLLDLERIDAGRFPLRPEAADLAALAVDTVHAFAPLAREQGIALSAPAEDEACRMRFDVDQIARVLGNLLSNALKFTPAGGRIAVTLDRTHERVRLSVADTGPGVPVEWRERIFDRFSQVGSEATRAREGAGLGLAICREIAQLHGGRLWVEAVAEGGAHFVLELPLEAAIGNAASRLADAADGVAGGGVPARRDPASAPLSASTVLPMRPATESSRRRILVAEDHPDLRAYVVAILREAYDVLEAEDGEIALQLARTALPDLVVSDVMMPRRDGFSLARELRAAPETSGIPLIFLTARAGTADEIEGLSSGADQYLRKPFDAALLRAHAAAAFAAVERLRRRFAAAGLQAPAAATDDRGAQAPASAAEDGEASSSTSTLDVDEAQTASGHAALATAAATPDAADRRFLAAAERWFDGALHDENAAIADLAAALHVSHATLGRRYARLTGETPQATLRRRRLERARDLLARGEGNVSEVAYAVGYGSLAAFSHAYRQHFGHAPSRTT